MKKVRISLPNNWEPRGYQLDAWNALRSGVRRVALVWHRRAGKDALSLNWTALEAYQRPGVYWHMAPQAAQARKIIWDAIDPVTGVKHIDQAFPKELRAKTRDHEMTIELINGSIWQVVGSDNYDSLVGAPPRGVVMSEYSIAKPQAWAYLSPILALNGGFAIFPFTPRGKNHGWKLYEHSKNDPKWYTSHLGIDKTNLIDNETLNSIRTEYRGIYGSDDGDTLFNQEFYCSWDAALVGSYYGRLLEEATQAGRIDQDIPYDRHLPLYSVWDIGVGDSTAIWFIQTTKFGQIRFIDYLEAHGHGLEHYVNIILEKEKEGWVFDAHWMPHDMNVTEFGSGKSRTATAKELGLRNIKIVDKLGIDHGIQHARRLIPNAAFSRECSDAVDMLRLYHREYDEEKKCFNNKPAHDYTSHCADAFRYTAVAAYHHGLMTARDRNPAVAKMQVEQFMPRQRLGPGQMGGRFRFNG